MTITQPLRVLLDSTQIYCKMNALALAKLARYLSDNGHELVDAAGEADVVVVATCAFSRDQYAHTAKVLGRYRIRARQDIQVMAVGCLNKIGQDLAVEFPGVVFASSPEELDRHFYVRTRYQDVGVGYVEDTQIDKLHHGGSFPGTLLAKQFHGVRTASGRLLQAGAAKGTRRKRELDEHLQREKVYVEIGSGCAGRCSYCVIQKARGKPTSRPIESILRDIEQVHDRKKAIYLTADDCGSYGLDTGTSLFGLVGAIDARFPGIGIDLCYVNAQWLDRYPDEYLAMFRKANIASANFTLQSGSNAVLRSMNRQYDVQRVLDIIDRISAVKEAFIWTHFMVGFPGETEEDFRKTLAAAEHFSFAYVFCYTDMEGTGAAALGNKVPTLVKKLREMRLMWHFLRRDGDIGRVASAWWGRMRRGAWRHDAPR